MKEITLIASSIKFYEAPNWTHEEIVTSTKIADKIHKIYHSKKSALEKTNLILEELKDMPESAMFSVNSATDDCIFLKNNDRWLKYESKIKI